MISNPVFQRFQLLLDVIVFTSKSPSHDEWIRNILILLLLVEGDLLWHQCQDVQSSVICLFYIFLPLKESNMNSLQWQKDKVTVLTFPAAFGMRQDYNYKTLESDSLLLHWENIWLHAAAAFSSLSQLKAGLCWPSHV